ncbi:membrane protein [Streptomyces phage Tomas]|uniref:Membrane protein n=1 Tax=Streptomyces phage Tomas TaxID=2914443 RepID=A0AA49BSD7_9CAUD|nr:membrane protein [Streptomyces phage Tomas]UMO76364.1 membrane protein [Streptomyces phage Tomas]
MEINRHRREGSFVRRHSLSLALFFVFCAQSIIVWFSGYEDWSSDQQAQHQQVAIWPDYLIHYVYEMAVSLVADTYGALLLVLFAKWFYEKGSPESGD